MATNDSYPHPVLGDTDDVSSLFEVINFTVAPTVEDIEVRFEVRMTDADIQKFIDNGSARYSFRWSCTGTISSQELKPQLVRRHADRDAYESWLDQRDVRGKVSIEISIVATEKIDHYGLANQHPDYDDATFRILPGDILAYVGPFDFEPTKRYDPLDPPVGSLFQFVQGKRSPTVQVDFSDPESILVMFDPDLLPGVAAMSVQPWGRIGLIVLPALMQTITFIKENDEASDGEDLKERLWYGPICRMVEEHGGFVVQAFVLAQRILGNALKKALEEALNREDEE